jgi:hypothetical protein
MTVNESQALNKGTRVYWRVMPPTAALSLKQIGMSLC